MSLKQDAIKGVAWSAAQKWGMRIISAAVTIILARLILPEAFGLVAYATVFLSLAQIFVDQGFSDAIVQFPKLDREHLDTSFWISVITGSGITLITLLGAGLIANLFHEPRLAAVLRWMSPVFIISALSSVQVSILRRNLQFRSLTIRSLVAMTVSGIVAVVMAFLGCGVWSLVAKLMVDGVVSVIVLWRVSNWRPSFRFSGKHFKELFAFGVNIIGGDFVDFLSVHSDDFLIGYFLGPIALGYYTLAYNLLLMLTDLLVTVPNLVAFPIFSKVQDDSIRLKSAFLEVTQLQSLIAFPIFLGIFAVAPEAVRVIYTDKWVSSIPVIQILMLIGIIRSAVYFYSSIFRAAGKPSWRFGLYSLAAVLNVVGFLLTVRMGIVAVAISYVVVSYVLMPLYFYMIQKIIHVSTLNHLKQYMPALISSVFMIAVVFLGRYLLADNLSVTVRLVILVIAGGATYLLGIRIIQPALYAKMLGLARMVIPKSLERRLAIKNSGPPEIKKTVE